MSKNNGLDRELLLDLLLEHTADALYITKADKQGTILEVNQRMCQSLDYTRDELLTMTIADIDTDFDPKGFKEFVDQLTPGVAVSSDVVQRRKDGSTIEVELRLRKIETNGETMLVALGRDITERRQVEGRLRENQEFLQSVLDSNPQHVFVKDKDLVYLGCNQKLAEVVGLEKPEDIAGLTDYDLPWSKEEADFFRSVDREVMESNIPQLGIIEPQQQADGTQAWLETNKVPMHDAEGNVVGILGTFMHVTERIKAEQELAQERNLLRTLIDNIPGAHIFVKDAQNRFLLTNQAQLKMLGVNSEDEIIGKSDLDLFPKELAEQYFADEQSVIRSGEPILNRVEPGIDPNGRQKWYLTHKLPLQDSDGTVTGLVGMSLDITERKQLEQTLQESEQRLVDIIEFLPSPTFAIDKEGKVIAWNRACETALGIEAKDILGKGDYEYALPFYGERRPILIDLVFESPEEIEQKYSAIKREGETLIGEATVYPQGQPRYFVGTATPLYDADENLVGAIETFRDITEQKQIETAMQESEQRLSDIINFLPTPTFVIDREGTVIAWNQAIADVTGVEAEEILGKGNYEYALPFFGKRRVLLIDLIFESDEEIAKNYTNVRRDGNRLFAENRVFPRGIERYYDLSAAGLYDSQGNLVGAIETFRDITEQKQVEEELRKYQDQLEEQVETRTAELEDRVRELNALQRLMSREGWQDFQAVQETAARGYLFDQNAVKPVATAKDVGNGNVLLPVPTQPSPDNNHALTRSVSVRGEVIGQLGVYDDPNHPLQPEDQEFLDSVAEQVAEALERARLLRQTQTALAETENLYEVGRHVSEANNLQEILAVVGESGPVSIFDRITLETFERDASDRITALEIIANWSSTEDIPSIPVGSHFPLAQFPHLKMFITDKPVFIDDIQRDAHIDSEAKAAIAQMGLKATAVLPLFTGDQQFGVLVLGSAEAYHFTEREMQPYIALVGQIAVAVENQRLLAETGRALAEAEEAQRRYTVQTWDVYRSKQIIKSYEQSRDNLPAFNSELPPEVSRAVSTRQTVVVTTSPQLSSGETQAGSNEAQALSEVSQSGLAVPLTVRGEVIGVLGMQETDANRQWTPEEIALVEAIAEQMAQAAEGIRLLDDSQQRAARERRVNEIGDKIQGAQSLEEALQIAVKEVGLSLEAPQTKVKLSVD